MKTRQESMPASDRQFELKYCERCGVLWVRPVGGEQIYCAGCGREVDELPPVSRQAESGTVQDSLWSGNEDEDMFFERYEQDVIVIDPTGGVA